MLSGRELMSLKAAALLHDPPHKAWVVLSRYKADELSGGGSPGRRLKVHEREAYGLAERILRGTPFEGAADLMFKDVVRRADGLASSIDRVLHSSEGEGSSWGTVDVANMFDPKHGRILNEGKVPGKDGIGRYARELNEVLKETLEKDDYVTAYHALYALMEARWFNSVGLIGPADTRIPNHTIFDHLYATATAVNIVAGKTREKPYGGFLVLLDIAGVQSFISKARKASDYWAGSWLVSAIAWYLVREVVEKIGPDCLVMPTARVNPFYLTWLLGRARLKGYGKLAESIEDTFKNLVKYGWPRNPVIPGTLVLLLPDDALQILGATDGGDAEPKERLRKYFLSRYAEAWKEVINAVKEGLGKDVGSVLTVIKDAPPALLRVNIVGFSEVYDELLSKVEEHAEAFLYHHALTKLFFKRPSENMSVEPGSFLNWGEIIGNNKDYRLCSVCGKLPAVNERLLEKLKDKLLIKREGNRKERLCLYCLVKRAIRYRSGRNNVLDRVVERLVGSGVKVREGSEVVFPSTSDIAALWAKLELLYIINRIRDEGVIKSLFSKVINLLSSERKDSSYEGLQYRGLKLPSVKEPEKIEGIPAVLRNALKVIRENWGDEDPRNLLALLLIVGDAENLLLSSENVLDNAVRDLNDRLLNNYLRNVRESLRRYYVILKADADGMGEVLSGRKALVSHEGDWKDKREETLIKYYEEILGEETLRKYSEKRGVVRASARRLSRVLEKYEKLFNIGDNRKVFMPVSLSYHSCASRALMITALRDIKNIERYGTVIYAGGDDLLALVPTVIKIHKDSKAMLTLLDAVISTREVFWASASNGFLMEAGISPALRATGRSYSLMIAHYRDPMGALIEQAEEGLGKAKDTVLKKLSKEGEGRKKDSTYIGYGRGTPLYTVIPNKVGEERCNTLRAIEELFTMVEEEIISEGTPRDVEAWEDTLMEVLRNYSVEKAVNMLTYVLKRNSKSSSWARVEEFIKNYVQNLKDFYAIAEERGSEAWVPLSLFRALRLVQGGDR